ncbi:MAG: undecaprenyl-diphosphate phosphatase [Bacteroidales bacterium]|jgi:undecaprenyl-diphosphatase|nr:undecaprenyl-diphosphate phosphatase [Bacteroidales bacterium]MCI1784783.1 undecaprenyl-diphosphate phosphatase [Bacteroidales bacterium]
MNWWQAFLLGIVQGLTEFLPVSSSGHLMIFKELMGVDAEGFLDFTVTVHMATVLSTIVVFWSVIKNIVKGFFKFSYNDETDYLFKIIVSMIPVGIVGVFFKDKVESLFGNNLFTVAIFLIITAVLLYLADKPFNRKDKVCKSAGSDCRNGISYWQAFVVGIGQACSVAPGLSRSGTTIATGLICGVKREVIAQFSFLMVLIPIIGEQFLNIAGGFSGLSGDTIGWLPLTMGFISAFLSGLFACKVMISIVKKAKLIWFSLYCLVVALLILIFI